MDDSLPEELTAEERAGVAKLRAEKRLLTVLEPILEQRRCQQWAIPYDEENPSVHRSRLDNVDLALREMYQQHTRNWKWIGGAWRAVGVGSASVASKLWSTLMGALVLIGLGWVATKLGVKFPGVP